MRPSDIISCALALFWATATLAEAPQRVVSLNLCTDQMAMALAAPGQLVSVSALAADPRSSAMAEQATGFPANNGSAEAVVLLQPDLILAGTWTTQASISILQELGYRIERFAPVNSLAEARANITRMGALLGREAQADRMVAVMDERLETLRGATGPAPRAALYYALGNTAGPDSLPGEILSLAGFDNIAADLGIPFYGALPLETLVLQDPDLILIGRPYGGHARATELLTHPALDRAKLRSLDNGANWVCEGPALLDAIADMVALRQDWSATR